MYIKFGNIGKINFKLFLEIIFVKGLVRFKFYRFIGMVGFVIVIDYYNVSKFMVL